MNPLKGACSKKNCKYRCFLRRYSIFGIFPKIPVQILMYIIEQFIIEKKNATLIWKAIKINIMKLIWILELYINLWKLLGNVLLNI